MFPLDVLLVSPLAVCTHVCLGHAADGEREVEMIETGQEPGKTDWLEKERNVDKSLSLS